MTAYYNELDPYAAQWLRNLIASGHIAPGDVDERSITEVHPDDLRGYTQCHFFAGIGGWSYALRLAGWPDDRPVWTGSCPCQPFSAAGKQRGSEDERHLWPAFFRLIRECRPCRVFGEQVAGAAGLAWLDHVCADLEGAGYAAAAANLGAHSVGAPHIRQRLYWIANSLDNAGSIGWRARRNDDAQHDRQQPDAAGHAVSLGHTNPQRSPGSSDTGSGEGMGQPWAQPAGAGADVGLADAYQGERRRVADGEGSERDRTPAGWHKGDGFAESCGVAVSLADATEPRPQGRDEHGQRADAQRAAAERDGALHVGGRMGESQGCRWPGSELRTAGRMQASGATQAGVLDPWATVEWLPCSDGKARPTQPGLFPLAHGIPGRVGRLRAYGNAIVPPLAAKFIEACMT